MKEQIFLVLFIILGFLIGSIIASYGIHCGYDLEWFFSKLDKLFGRTK